MPSLIKEVTQGHSKSRASGGVDTAGSGSASRVFRVILNQPGEVFDPPSACGVSLGSVHPDDSNFTCIDYTATYEGESRSVVNVTFNYTFKSQSGGDQNQPPDIRPATWSLSSTLMERPCTMWRRFSKPLNVWGPWQLPINPAGDIYDGVTTMEPVVAITITQHCASDPTFGAMHVGSINSEYIRLGTLTMDPHTVMLRSVQSTPVVETFGDVIYKGWTATWEFAYRQNVTRIHYPDFTDDNVRGQSPDKDDAGSKEAIGWDIAVPVTGLNVIAPAGIRGLVDADFKNNSSEDAYAVPLAHGKEDSKHYMQIDQDNFRLNDGVKEFSKQRAMVRVPSYGNGGSSQAPAALPVPLNPFGYPRNTEPFADGSRYYPIVWRYQIHQELNFTQVLRLRLN